MNARSLGSLVSLVAVAALVVGCGGAPDLGKTASVSGKVTLDGKPVTGKLMVVFMGADGTSFGEGPIGSGGAYQIGEVKPGPYSVFVGSSEEEEEVEVDENATGPETPVEQSAETSAVPVKYQVAATSGLSTTLKEGDNKYDVVMTGSGEAK